MPRPRYTPAALRDLREIVRYIARENPARARSFRDEIRDRCRRLAEFPDAAPLRPDFAPGVRMTPFRSYLIFYAERDGTIVIERILHGARHWTGDPI